MRIIGGCAAGLKLQSPRGRAVRPTSDRVKESLFAVLGDITDCRAADLFAGSGALGLEALSRGAQSVVFVEKNPRHVRLISENARRLEPCLPADVRPDISVIQADVKTVPKRLAGMAGDLDLVLADPPYNPAGRSWGAATLLSDPAFHQWVGSALLVIEHAVEMKILTDTPGALWDTVAAKKYGSTAVTFCRAHSVRT